MKNLGTILTVLLAFVLLPLGGFFLWRQHAKAATAEGAMQKAQASQAALVAANAAPAAKPSGGGGVDYGALAGGAVSAGLNFFSNFSFGE